MDDDLDHTLRSGNPTDTKPYALSGKIMLSAIVILFFVVLLMVSLHLYARWYLLRARRRQLHRRRNRLNHARRTQIVFYVDNNNPTNLISSDPANRGLEPAVLNSLPLFVYSSKTHPNVMDCAVCLSEFEDKEMGRVLPKCNHSFHIECIDMWFHSHSTCPLCRSPVEKFSQSDNNESDVVIDLGEPEPTQTEPGCSSSSLGERRKAMAFNGVRIEIPMRSELENELLLSSPASQRFTSPGTRLLSFKRLLSMGRKTPTTPPPNGPATTPCGAGTSWGALASETELEGGTTELTRARTPR
ncbi:hypothetical protein M9H77_36837 [Catharanthus roseus]|uniref:Uncharacterized protein n=1 Tax=Catharanthus roseus TaxID=4058 RepID=A0ACB9ZV54_CATRO|nr:hypothetical protein M9H77_36837 [Catharanthus roseus]